MLVVDVQYANIYFVLLLAIFYEASRLTMQALNNYSGEASSDWLRNSEY